MILFFIIIQLFCGRISVSYYSSLSFLLSSSLVVSSLADKAANGADPGQKKPV